MKKTELRKLYKEKRQSLTTYEVENKSLEIANHLIRLDILEKTYYHIFLPIEGQKEVDTEFILQILAGKDKDVIISKSDFETRKMTHFLLTDNTKIKKNEYNIPEPVDGIEVPSNKIDVVFIPLLAFDKKGNRVGYGKGFYDIFLDECKSDVLKIGLSYFEAEEIIEDMLPTDIQLDYCVTPNLIYTF